jgi:formylglycine-generating enzyme required for sulfatase activity
LHRISAVALVVLVLCPALYAGAETETPGQNPPTTELVLVPAGEFQMGRDGDANNSPAHRVRLDSFYMDKHEVTNAQYLRFCKETERQLPIFWGMERFRCGPDFPDHPVVGVSWADAKAYAEWAGKRLPTEAEWEYAARGGLEGKGYPNGDDLDESQANFRSDGTVPVMSYSPNAYGLYDMAGNVREWVADYYDEFYYGAGPAENPKGPEKGTFHVVRDGGWHSGKGCLNVDDRICLPTYWVDFAVGFRCAADTR